MMMNGVIVEVVPYIAGDMIGCDNDSCPIKWFHMDGLNIDSVSDDKWFCLNCQLEQ